MFCNIHESKCNILREESDLEALGTEALLVSLDPLGARRLPVLDDALISEPLGVRASAAYLLLRFRVSGRSCWATVHNRAHRCLHGRWGFRAAHFSSSNSGMIWTKPRSAAAVFGLCAVGGRIFCVDGGRAVAVRLPLLLPGA